ncbi:NAD(P)-binding domain protein [Cordyceps fumosorosea ARSEF 2679]|uniref:NAD(P)-binding domain protein n=1 Tax=Cordyceps fumosorosea (strain ARSEF 2679) TaxID=1081104 RepID=A0A167XJB8_CORFA|nr:NAD(P)-binding domain protein [Cordyceps fumosorosea ARSEF 2679]OAA65039.1 NAD(P)-binding domain protein [Cordyceps fumosorosea ARSEF 2679]
MAPIGVAIIGSGIFVKEQHIPAVLHCELLSLKAIFSRSFASAQAAAALLPATAHAPELYAEDAAAEGRTLTDLLARDDVAGVVVALPIPAQPAVVRAALAAGKHVLAEKPLAPDVASARALMGFAASDAVRGATLSVAENQRFFPRFMYALEQLAGADLGRVTHFAVRVSDMVGEDGKYYKTAWRKTPAFQGGFLLDGGVHFAAGARMLLLRSTDATGDAGADVDAEAEARPARVSARTALVRPHHAPVDSVAALVTTHGGATGTYQHSVGSTISAYEFDVAYERGSVRICDGEVTVAVGGREPVRRTFERASGVPEEVAAWAAGIRDGKPHPAQSAREALADLEFIEKMLQSAEQDGKWLDYEFQ